MFTDITALDVLLRSLIFAAFGLAWVIVTVRIIGLRTFSKMTSFDFVATIATGSLLAGAVQATSWSALFQPLLGITAVLGLQMLLAMLRQHSDPVRKALQNNATVLMRDGVIDQVALDATRVDRSDLIAKLREANVLDPGKVRAVVLETTGDISVLHGDHLDPMLLEGIHRDP